MEVRTVVKEKMFIMSLIFVTFTFFPSAFTEEVPAYDEVARPNATLCGNDELYTYDPDNERCLVNFKKVVKRIVIPYRKSEIVFLAEDETAQSIYIEGENVFKGIMISVILFMTCASICVVTACIYCCRINLTDRTLNRNVKALAKKLKQDYNSKKMESKRTTLPPVSESCSVVVEPAGVFVA